MFQGGVEALALLGDHVQDDWLLAALGELERLDQQGQVVSVDRTEVADSKFLKNQAAAEPTASVGIERVLVVLEGHLRDGALDRLLPFQPKANGQFSGRDFLEEMLQIVGDFVVAGIGDQLVEIVGNRTDILGDRPLVIVEDANEFVRGVGDVVERLKRTAVGQGGIAENADDILVAPPLVTGGGHAQRGGQGSAGVACAVAVVLTFRAQRKAVQAVRGADGAEPVLASGQQLVHVGLVAHVPDELVLRRLEHAVHGHGQLHHAEIRTEMAAVLGESLNEFHAQFLG